MKPRRNVSLIVPTFNGALLIGTTLASIAGGEHLPGEVIVVDDGSSDQTAEEVDKWKHLLPLVYLPLPENVGLANARNAAVEQSRFSNCAFLDGDDVALPDHVRLLVDKVEQTGGLVSTGAMYWHPDGKLAQYSKPFRRERVPKTDQLGALIQRNFVFVAACAPKERLLAAGGFKGYPGSVGEPLKNEDWHLWLRLVARGLTVETVDRTTVLYRVRANSLAASERQMFLSAIQMLEDFEKDFPEHRKPVEESIFRLGNRIRVSDLQQASFEEQKRVPLTSLPKVLNLRDPQVSVRALLLCVLPPNLASLYLGRRGAW